MRWLFNIPKSMKEDIALYKEDVKKFLSGEMHPTQFRGKRVPMGIYEQRENGTYMMRIRIPAGGITSSQMTEISKIAKDYGSGILHVTTRQDIQLHKLRLEETPIIMEKLLNASLITKGGGGNTVRNITSCSNAGICQNEIFDPSPYALSLTEALINDNRSFSLPRKFKVSFAGCNKDCSGAMFNDVGFIPHKKMAEGEEVYGFKMYAGGGMGVFSRIGDLIEDFVPISDIANVCEAVKRVFDKHGNRKNKHKARLRFLIDKLGLEGFLKLYQEELKEIKSSGGVPADIKGVFPANPYSRDPYEVEIENQADYNAWAKRDVIFQRQEDFYIVIIRLPLGDIDFKKLERFSSIAKRFGDGSVKATHDQNLSIRWIKGDELKGVYSELKNAGFLSTSPAIADVVCCTGSSTCRLGICLSRGLSKNLTKEIENHYSNLKDIDDISIKISGCPNACGRHPTSPIGLFGAARRVGDRFAPYYSVVLGGRTGCEEAALAENMGFVHVKVVPVLLSKFLKAYAEKKNKYSDYYKYLEMEGKKTMRSLIEEYSHIPSYNEDKSFYIDIGAEEEFSLAGRGAGECGAGIFDMIEVDLEESAKCAAKGEKETDPSKAASCLYEAVKRAAGALLVTKGVEAKDDIETLSLFEKLFISAGLIDSSYMKLIFSASEYKKGNLRDNALIEKKGEIKGLVEAVKELYSSMDETLQFVVKNKKPEKIDTATDVRENKTELFDLRGVKCPINYVKTKLKLEMMELGESLDVYLDEGEPINNVPNSLKNDGQEIVSITKKDEGYYSVVVKKKAG